MNQKSQGIKIPVFKETIPTVRARVKMIVRKIRTRLKMGVTYGAEQSSAYYDRTYEKSSHWKKHYTKSHYYPIWTVIADRIRQAVPKKILDIGCGPGQIACLLRDIGIPEYIGIDFSKARIARAKEVCPEYTFAVENVFETKIFQTADYDMVLTLEFLEHVEGDIDVLSKLRKGTMVIGTVPNFPAAGHVRYFESIEAVEERYKSVLNDLRITSILANANNKTYFLLQGIR